jgi:hypothetical protein
VRELVGLGQVGAGDRNVEVDGKNICGMRVEKKRTRK